VVIEGESQKEVVFGEMIVVVVQLKAKK